MKIYQDIKNIGLVEYWMYLLLSGLLVLSTGVFADDTLNYDLKGNIVSRQNTNGTTNFQYDNLNRLIDEQGPQATQAFTYDANGNRLTDGVGSYTYAPNSNVMATEHGNTVVHDVVGNLTENGQGITYEYNQAGRLKRVYDNSTLVATYTYNAFGQRTRKVTPSSTTVYHYDLNGQLIEETLADGAPQTTYVWRDNKPTAVIFEPSTSSNNTALEKAVYLHTDHLNTPRSATDNAKTTVWRWETDAFGSMAVDSDSDSDGNQTVVNLRFPGQYFDIESGLHNNWNRYYMGSIGRYATSDPIGLDGGQNTFSYVFQSPIRFIDPTGLDSQLSQCTCPTDSARDFVIEHMGLHGKIVFDVNNGGELLGKIPQGLSNRAKKTAFDEALLMGTEKILKTFLPEGHDILYNLIIDAEAACRRKLQ